MEETTREKAQSTRIIRTFYAFLIVAFGAFIGWFVWSSTVQEDSAHPFKLGLDLAGGSHLVYEADTEGLLEEEVPELMDALRDVIENRVNRLGVSEPLVQIEESSFVTEERIQRLVVELPGVTDVEEAIAAIGETPLLEFKLVSRLAANEAVLDSVFATTSVVTPGETLAAAGSTDDDFIDTGLTGRYLKNSQLVFGQSHGGGLANEPIVQVTFDSRGADLFAQLTRENIGEQLAIFLDGELVSAPTINEAIVGGTAVISGGFDAEEARALAQNLNFGALPIAIELQTTQTIGASLGAEILGKGIVAGSVGIGFVMLFMMVWYRLPGVVAVISLSIYIVSMLALFKLIPVTLTAAGLAGFILSVGMAVDANVLVFERMKEELRAGKSSREAAKIGFLRAWSAIRDGNITSILSALILFWFGTSIVKGFALVFGLGVIFSMVSALLVTRTLLLTLPDTPSQEKSLLAKLYRSGF